MHPTLLRLVQDIEDGRVELDYTDTDGVPAELVDAVRIALGTSMTNIELIAVTKVLLPVINAIVENEEDDFNDDRSGGLIPD